MFNIKKLFRKLTRKSLSKYAYIQITPLSLNTSEILEDTLEKRRLEILNEINCEFNEFLNWVGLEKNSKDWTINLIHGYKTVFVMFSSFEPEIQDIKSIKAHKNFTDKSEACELLSDIEHTAIVGDTNAKLHGQEFSGRCRWIKRHN